MSQRVCGKCGGTEFYANKNAQCKACHRVQKRAWRKANPEKLRIAKRAEKKRQFQRDPTPFRRAKRRRLLRKYGLTTATYQSLWDAQGGKCGICTNDLRPGVRTAVDHDHGTGA